MRVCIIELDYSGYWGAESLRDVTSRFSLLQQNQQSHRVIMQNHNVSSVCFSPCVSARADAGSTLDQYQIRLASIEPVAINVSLSGDEHLKPAHIQIESWAADRRDDKP